MAGKQDNSVITPLPKRRTLRQLEDEERWNNLAEAVALDGMEKDIHLSRVDYSQGKGSLVVIGSGIKCVGQFSLEAISHLKNADKVLYCVADPATEHFIHDLCPDALDMYVLYDNGKPRYETYVQMAEVTLYYARQGLNTVMVFYGHPGIFVLPSHRAIKIAQQQGIKTTMLPAISALDCLTADLGIDPSYPGMITFEATDLLLRNRTLLTDMHVIIWQVGCVGDLGFTRTGYMNQNLPVLIKHLQGIYGNDYIITHYIGAQYPMCTPTIVELPLSKFLAPVVTKTITGISTFYIPPMKPKDAVPAIVKKLGLDKENFITSAPLVKPYTQCGPQEKKAIHDMLEWKVPHEYSHFTPTKVGEYLGNVAQDADLLKKHKSEPVKTMKEADLSYKEVATLLKESPGPFRILMTSNTQTTATKVAIRLLTDPKFASAFYAEMQKYKTDPNLQSKMSAFLALKGYSTTMADVSTALTDLQKTSLLPWSGEYSTNQSITLTIQGDSQNTSLGTVHVNTTQITKFTFTNQTLAWSSADGNSSSATLAFVDGGSNKLSFTGKYWISTNQAPFANNISGQNTATKSSLSNWVGTYDTTYSGTKGLTLIVKAVQSGSYTIYIGNAQILHYTFGSNDVLSWSESYNNSNGELTFSVENAGTPQVRRKFSGYYWAKGYTKSQSPNYIGTINVADFSSYVGMYRSTTVDSKGTAQYGLECFLTNQSNSATFTIGTTAIKSPSYSNSTITWSKSSGNTNSGIITFHIDPNKHTAAFYGKAWTGSTAPSSANFYGSLDTTYLTEWAGVYTTYSQFDSTWSPGAQLVLNAATAPKDIQISYGGTSIMSPSFNNPVLSWSSSDGNITNAHLTFYYPKNSKSPKCYGKLWIDTKPTKDTFQGAIDSAYLQSWTGTYNSYFKDSNGQFTVDAPTLTIFGGVTESASTVFVGGVAITKFKYSTEGSTKYGYLQWSDTDNNTGGDIKFYIDSSLVRSIFGKYWDKGNSKPTTKNWYGNTNPRTPHYATAAASSGSKASTALKNYWTWYNVLDALAMGLILMGIILLAQYVGKRWAQSRKAKQAEKEFEEQQKKVQAEDQNEDSIRTDEPSDTLTEAQAVEAEVQNSGQVDSGNAQSSAEVDSGQASGSANELPDDVSSAGNLDPSDANFQIPEVRPEPPAQTDFQSPQELEVSPESSQLPQSQTQLSGGSTEQPVTDEPDVLESELVL